MKYVKLGDVASYINGYAFKPSDYSSEGKPIIRIQNLTGNAYQTNLYNGEIPQKYLITKGDVLISWSASLGVYEWTGEEAYLNQHIFKVCFDKQPVNKNFFVHQTAYAIKKASSQAHGSTMTHLTKKVFESISFAYPSLDKQMSIGAVLDKVKAQLILNKKYLLYCDELVKSRFIEMFGDPCDSQRSTMSCCPIEKFCEVRIGPFGSALHKSDYVFGGHALVNPSHIVKGKIKINKKLAVNEEKYASMKAYHLKKGDVVLGRRGEIGRCAVVNQEGLLCGTGSMILRPDVHLCLSEYLQHIVSFPTFAEALERDAVGVTMKNLNAKIVENAVVVLPPMSLQREFISFVHQVDKLKFDFDFLVSFKIPSICLLCLELDP